MIRTMPQADHDLETARAAVARIDAQITRAEDDSYRALAVLADLMRARDSGDFEDAAKLARDLENAQAAHDATLATVANLRKMRAPLEKKEEQARARADAARAQAAKPEGDRLEAEARRAFDEFCMKHKACLAYRRAHKLACTGMHASYDQNGNGLLRALERHGLSDRFGLRRL